MAPERASQNFRTSASPCHQEAIFCCVSITDHAGTPEVFAKPRQSRRVPTDIDRRVVQAQDMSRTPIDKQLQWKFVHDSVLRIQDRQP